MGRYAQVIGPNDFLFNIVHRLVRSRELWLPKWDRSKMDAVGQAFQPDVRLESLKMKFASALSILI
jgi:hypothetical protein